MPILAVALALLVPATAQAFDPATQSHPGACSETTVDVHRAVHDLHANEVLDTYVGALGIDAAGKSKVKAAEEELVVVKLHRAAVAANHGCELGIVFPIGQRRLHAGEKVAIRVPSKLRDELCAGPGKNCVARRLKENVVLPINCWNIEEGKFVVVVYVRKQPPPPPPPKKVEMAMPSATAQLSCTAGAVLVKLENDPKATADASFLVNGTHQGPVGPGGVRTVSVPVASGKSVEVTVTSGGKALLEHVYTSHCGSSPTPATPAPPSKTVTPRVLPAAAATLTCTFDEVEDEFIGHIDVTLYNAVTATTPANFEVIYNGAHAKYGPVAPGQIQKIPGPVFTSFESENEVFEVEVLSGGTRLYYETYDDACIEAG